MARISVTTTVTILIESPDATDAEAVRTAIVVLPDKYRPSALDLGTMGDAVTVAARSAYCAARNQLRDEYPTWRWQ